MVARSLHQLENHWLRVLWGQPSTTATLTSTSIRIERDGTTANFDAEEADVRLERGWIFSRLVVEPTDGRPRAVVPVRHARAATFASTFLIAKHRDKWKEAVEAFDRLLTNDSYLNGSRVTDWAERYRPLASVAHDIHFSALPDHVEARFARRYSQISATLIERVRKRNDRFVEDKKRSHKAFFDTVTEYPLTDRQREAILRDQDALLVVAGAGTGKTTAVVGKIGYLIQHGGQKPDHLLALAFNREAAREMRERVRSRVGSTVEVRTFHSIALKILQDVEGKRASVGSIAKHEKERNAFVSEVLSDLFADPNHRQTYVDFAVYHRTPAPFKPDFESREEYLEYMAGLELMTLQGERVKSFEERLIADWLTLHGIAYKYEFPYEQDTSSPHRREYKPDFYLPNHGIYLEHFGVDRNDNTAPWIPAEKYRAGMRWKRELHREHGTTLVETFSYERMEGILLESLENKLGEHGVEPRPISHAQVRKLVEQPGVQKPLVALLSDFLVTSKENLYSLSELRAAGRKCRSPERAQAFLNLFELVYDRYEHHLHVRREIDFADMIRRATRYVEEGRYAVPFRRIVVDEFQDISRGRLKFLHSLLGGNDRARLFAVGDDWQSIYGFTGSDVSIMSEFGSVFEHTERVDLDRTFRFSDRMASASSTFIQTEDDHLEKDFVADRSTDRPPIHCVLDPEVQFSEVIDEIAERASEETGAEVLILGRYSFSEPNDWQTLVRAHSNIRAEYLTVHKAKGLEADFVVVVDLKSGKYGFPSGVRSDPLMRLILPEAAFGVPEERRLFYVAMTRARDDVYLMTVPRAPRSPFVEELQGKQYEECVRVVGESGLVSVRCPECEAGSLVRVRKRKYGQPWICQFHPYCSGAVPICSECTTGPLLSDGRDYRCQLGSCGARIPRCERCDVRMSTYTSKKHGRSARCPTCNSIRRLDNRL